MYRKFGILSIFSCTIVYVATAALVCDEPHKKNDVIRKLHEWHRSHDEYTRHAVETVYVDMLVYEKARESQLIPHRRGLISDSRTQSKCSHGSPLSGIFCGRGPSHQNCPVGYFCHIDSADRFAVCCPNLQRNIRKHDFDHKAQHGHSNPSHGHEHDHHHMNDEVRAVKKEMTEHMNIVCVSQILWEIENMLGYSHRLITTRIPPTTTQTITTQSTTSSTSKLTTTHPTQPTTTGTTTTVASTTVQSATTIQSTPRPLSTVTLPPVPLNVSHVCKGLAFVRVLAKGNTVTHPYAGRCTDGSNSQSEALLLDVCQSQPPSVWTQKQNVMANCDRIPPFTPVATFIFGQYPMDGTSLSGIFIECTPGGFKMSVQICGHGPEIFELKSGYGSMRQNADNYFIVDWK